MAHARYEVKMGDASAAVMTSFNFSVYDEAPTQREREP